MPLKARSDSRTVDQLRPVSYVLDVAPNATASVLICFGNTRVICAAMIQEDVPRWMKSQGKSGGWLTAEYSMLPYSTLDRKERDGSRGRPDGRSIEIQRLIGRSLRAAVDLEKLGSRTLCIDCDVLQADGGTRTASITGACIAAAIAFNRLLAKGKIVHQPLKKKVAAISTGVVSGTPLLDLCYVEDVDAEVDANIVMTEDGQFVELQSSGEEATFSREQFNTMVDLGWKGIQELVALQDQAIREAETVATTKGMQSLATFFNKS
jgi:ribonuclease PH